MQALLTGERSLDLAAWSDADSQAPAALAIDLKNGWVQPLLRPLQEPTCRIPDDCVDKKRYPLFMARAVLALEEEFCLGRTGVAQDEADALCAAAAD